MNLGEDPFTWLLGPVKARVWVLDLAWPVSCSCLRWSQRERDKEAGGFRTAVAVAAGPKMDGSGARVCIINILLI